MEIRQKPIKEIMKKIPEKNNVSEKIIKRKTPDRRGKGGNWLDNSQEDKQP